MKYRTIVADPPWRYKGSLPRRAFNGSGTPTPWRSRSAVPYPTMSIAEIAALPVASLAAPDAHLYLWTTNTHLFDARAIAEAWGFKYSTLLVWPKAPRGLVGGAAFTICTEFVLFCRRGSLPAKTRLDRNWWQWPRGKHSAKPDAFQDIVEQVSPDPYLELFARRKREGWAAWGNEVESDIAMAAD